MLTAGRIFPIRHYMRKQAKLKSTGIEPHSILKSGLCNLHWSKDSTQTAQTDTGLLGTAKAMAGEEAAGLQQLRFRGRGVTPDLILSLHFYSNCPGRHRSSIQAWFTDTHLQTDRHQTLKNTHTHTLQGSRQRSTKQEQIKE